MWRIPKKLAGPERKLYSREERKIMHPGIVWWEAQWTQIGIWGALKTQSEQVELSGCPSTDREQRKFLLFSIVRGIVKSEVGWNPFLYEPRKYSQGLTANQKNKFKTGHCLTKCQGLEPSLLTSRDTDDHRRMKVKGFLTRGRYTGQSRNWCLRGADGRCPGGTKLRGLKAKDYSQF